MGYAPETLRRLRYAGLRWEHTRDRKQTSLVHGGRPSNGALPCRPGHLHGPRALRTRNEAYLGGELDLPLPMRPRFRIRTTTSRCTWAVSPSLSPATATAS